MKADASNIINKSFTRKLVALGFMLLGSQAYAQNNGVSQDVINDAKGSYIFVFNDNVPTGRVPHKASEIAVEHSAVLRHIYTDAIKGFSANMSENAAKKIAEKTEVAYYEQNSVVSAAVIQDAGYQARNSGKLKATGRVLPVVTVPQQTPYGILRVGGPLDGSGKHAWIIDTGIDQGNKDLNIGFGANFIRGKDSTHDLNGHGTHVAGTVAALNNDIDVVGVAANAVVHPVRVLDSRGSGSLDGVIAGVDFVAANASAGDVANMSLGSKGYSQAMYDAIVAAANKGILFAVAAGNSSDYAISYQPASIEHANIYTVSAFDDQDVFAYFSNYGNPPIDYAAPGVAVASTQVGGGVVVFSGTSMASPHMAGLLLMMGSSETGVINTSGNVLHDPDGNPDPIAHH